MELNQKIILVTGYKGFIGEKLCEVLEVNGWTIVGIDHLTNSVPNAHIISIKCDILDKVALSNVLNKYKPAIVIHLAGGPARLSSHESYQGCFRINHEGSLNVIDAAINLPSLKKFIFLGSCEEYGSIEVPFRETAREMPATAYGMAKLSVTHLLQALSKTHDFPSLILRPSVIYGPGQKRKMFIIDLIDHLLKGQEFDMSGGDQTRDYVYIDDVIRAIMVAIKVAESGGEIINISSSIPIKIKELALSVATQFSKGSIELINFGEKSYRLGEQMKYYADNSKAKDLLGWNPQISLLEGIARTIEWRRLNIAVGSSNEA
jgi:nucleoside-diphosphate-sugar epimerase